MKEQIKNIYFSETPDVRVRIIEHLDNEYIKKNKKKYPFELFNSINVVVITSIRKFEFPIFKGYTWNGADIPRCFWQVIGSRTDNDFLIASLLHDFLLEFKIYMINEILKNSISVKEYRRLTSLIFRFMIKEQGTNIIKANIMSWCVDVFQMLNRRAWKI